MSSDLIMLLISCTKLLISIMHGTISVRQDSICIATLSYGRGVERGRVLAREDGLVLPDPILELLVENQNSNCTKIPFSD